ncbi:MAG: hypothetical protein DCC71_23365 [Proteobacteria bacterium]|nr:MAG: hypothetical protein DCC71_23365 [Pseudomonadota bacterium]
MTPRSALLVISIACAVAAPAALRAQDHTAIGIDAVPKTGAEQVTGALQGVRTIRLEGEPEPHLLAKVALEGGAVRVLDLGPVSHLRERKQSFQRGQQIRAHGRPGTINDVAVVVVERLERDGGAVAIPVRGGANASARRQAQSDNPVQRIVGGQVEDVKESRIRESGQVHRLVKIRTSRDRTIVADLGPQGASGLDLKKGDPILVQGTVGRLNGKPAVFAMQVAEVAVIDRTPPAR